MAAQPTPLVLTELPADRPAEGETFENFMRRHYGPHAAQRRFLADPSRYRAAVAGIGGGKSEVGAFDTIRHCLRYPGIKGIVAAPSYRMLKRSTLPALLLTASWWPELETVFHRSDMVIEFPGHKDAAGNPSQIMLGYAQNPESLRGPTVAFFWLDEGGLCSEQAWQILEGRIRQPGMPHRGWVTGTPKGKNWLYRRFVEDRAEWPAERQQRHGFHTWHTGDNPLYLQDPEFLRALVDSYGGETSDFYRQEIEAQFVAFSGLVYREFDEKQHVVSAADIPPLSEFSSIHAGIDWGTSGPGCILVGGWARGKFWWLDEAYERGKVISGKPDDDWVSTAKELRAKWGISEFHADPEDANAILSFQLAGLNCTKANNARLPGVREVQALIGGDTLRVVGDNCPNVIAEMGQYHWREDRDGNPLEDADPAKAFDHALDAGRYLVMGLTTPTGLFLY